MEGKRGEEGLVGGFKGQVLQVAFLPFAHTLLAKT